MYQRKYFRTLAVLSNGREETYLAGADFVERDESEGLSEHSRRKIFLS